MTSTQFVEREKVIYNKKFLKNLYCKLWLVLDFLRSNKMIIKEDDVTEI